MELSLKDKVSNKTKTGLYYGYIRTIPGGISLEEQILKIEGWCSSNGKTLSKIYSDGIFMFDDQDDLRNLYSAIGNGDTLICIDFEYIGMTTRDYLNATESFTKKGCKIIYTDFPEINNSSHGRFFSLTKIALYELEHGTGE